METNNAKHDEEVPDEEHARPHEDVDAAREAVVSIFICFPSNLLM